jgi:HSP20 family protein
MAEKQPESGKSSQELLVRHPGRGRGRGLRRPLEDMERMFEGMLPRGWMRPFDWPTVEGMMPLAQNYPPIDVVDRENEVVLRAQVPGVNKENLDISISDNVITIRGHSEQEEEQEKEDYYCREMSYGEFSRSITLPESVDADKATARMKEGVLEMTLPKIEGAKRRSIKVEGS